jgi:predicted outer membrane lipoprotein
MPCRRIFVFQLDEYSCARIYMGCLMGCQVDCEGLRRLVRAVDVMALGFFGISALILTAGRLSGLLSASKAMNWIVGLSFASAFAIGSVMTLHAVADECKNNLLFSLPHLSPPFR